MSLVQRLNAFAARQTAIKPAGLAFDRGVASFTFDDFPRSAFERGAAILKRRGARATFYAAGRFCGAREDGLDYYDAAMLRTIDAGGHEVGCHSFAHAPAPRLTNEALEADAAQNRAFLAAALGRDPGPLSYAYPYGLVCRRTKALVSGAYPSARGIHPGLNGAKTDLSQLRAIPLERRSWQAQTVERWIAAARDARAWIVFFSHDISNDPSPYGCTPTMLEHALDAAAKAELAVLPVREALAAAKMSSPQQSSGLA